MALTVQPFSLEATELQYLYADVLRDVQYAELDAGIKDDVIRPKLVALIRSTIH